MFPPVSPPHTAKILCAYQGSVSNSEAGEELRMDFFLKNIKEKCTLKCCCPMHSRDGILGNFTFLIDTKLNYESWPI